MVVWAVALAAGGPTRRASGLTWMHAAIGGFVAVAGLSVVLAARDIQHGLSWDLAVKKLALLGSYVSLFVIVASVDPAHRGAGFHDLHADPRRASAPSG